jgi:hypothetical protein
VQELNKDYDIYIGEIARIVDEIFDNRIQDIEYGLALMIVLQEHTLHITGECQAQSKHPLQIIELGLSNVCELMPELRVARRLSIMDSHQWLDEYQRRVGNLYHTYTLPTSGVLRCKGQLGSLACVTPPPQSRCARLSLPRRRRGRWPTAGGGDSVTYQNQVSIIQESRSSYWVAYGTTHLWVMYSYHTEGFKELQRQIVKTLSEHDCIERIDE